MNTRRFKIPKILEEDKAVQTSQENRGGKDVSKSNITEKQVP